MDDQPIEATAASHHTAGDASTDAISAILAIAHESAEAERERARATAAAIIESAEADAREIRDRASAEVAANLSSAAEMRRVAADAQAAAQARAAELIATAELERARLNESMDNDRTTTRSSLEAVIRDLQMAIGRLDGTVPDGDTIDITDDGVEITENDVRPDVEPEEAEAGPLNAAVRAVMARAIGSPTRN